MPARELIMLLVLMLVQFTGIMDMILVAPLELPLTRAFHKDAAWFASTILAFTVSSAVFGVLFAALLDRFNRKHTVLTLYLGFGIGQLLCSQASSPETFLTARIIGGAFAGLMAASASALVGDAVPPERHGIAAGIMNSAYALAFIVGVPLGAKLAVEYSWHAPFRMMVGLILCVSLLGAMVLPSQQPKVAPAVQSKGIFQLGIEPIFSVVRDRTLLRALLLNGGIMYSTYAVTPFVAAYLVGNLGFREEQIPSFYFVGGIITLLISVLVGFAGDKYGNDRAFILCTILAAIPSFIVTVFYTQSVLLAMAMVTIFMAPVTARTIPALAIALTVVPEALRGGFLSLLSAFQQLCLGLGAFTAGLLLVQHGARLEHFHLCGIVAAVSSLLCAPLAWKLLRSQPATT